MIGVVEEEERGQQPLGEEEGRCRPAIHKTNYPKFLNNPTTHHTHGYNVPPVMKGTWPRTIVGPIYIVKMVK